MGEAGGSESEALDSESPSVPGRYEQAVRGPPPPRERTMRPKLPRRGLLGALFAAPAALLGLRPRWEPPLRYCGEQMSWSDEEVVLNGTPTWSGAVAGPMRMRCVWLGPDGTETHAALTFRPEGYSLTILPDGTHEWRLQDATHSVTQGAQGSADIIRFEPVEAS